MFACCHVVVVGVEKLAVLLKELLGVVNGALGQGGSKVFKFKIN